MTDEPRYKGPFAAVNTYTTRQNPNNAAPPLFTIGEYSKTGKVVVRLDLGAGWYGPLYRNAVQTIVGLAINLIRIRARAQNFLQDCMCAQRGLWSACASAQADRSLRWSPEDATDSWLLIVCPQGLWLDCGSAQTDLNPHRTDMFAGTFSDVAVHYLIRIL